MPLTSSLPTASPSPCRGSRPSRIALRDLPHRTIPERAGRANSSLEVIGTPNGPGLAPELRTACDMQGLSSHIFRSCAAEIGAGFRNLPGLTCAHHRIGAGVSRVLLGLVDAPAGRFDRSWSDAIHPDLQR